MRSRFLIQGARERGYLSASRARGESESGIVPEVLCTHTAFAVPGERPYASVQRDRSFADHP